MKTLFILLLSLSLAIGDNVLQLGDSDFSSTMVDTEIALVMFYAPWCGHCKRLKPEFEKAASTLKEYDPPIVLVKVDCTEDGKETCSKYGVSGYPTIKIFRNGDATDYNGPRENAGIVNFMKSQAGPSCKDLTTIEEAEKFLGSKEVSVVYFGEGNLKDAFMKVGDKLREGVRFGRSSDSEVCDKYGYKDSIVLFRPTIMANKFEPSAVKYEGSEDQSEIEEFIKKNFHGLVGLRTSETARDFSAPMVIAYYNVDYTKNSKGTNYWRNRVLKVAQNFKDDFTFAIASNDDFQHELNEYGVEFADGIKPKVCALNAQSEKFVMDKEFSMETLEVFLKDLKEGNLEPFIKSESIPDNEGKAVKVAVAKNFHELVATSDKDILIEFYAPWCGHCKKLEPIFQELGEKMADEDVDIVKMDATANDVPPAFEVKGFPTLYWKPKGANAIVYNGGRELDDFVKYISESSTDELKLFTRDGKPRNIEL